MLLWDRSLLWDLSLLPPGLLLPLHLSLLWDRSLPWGLSLLWDLKDRAGRAAGMACRVRRDYIRRTALPYPDLFYY